METSSFSSTSSSIFPCSYPTYEEWKLCATKIRMEPLDVLILPMRNGNTITYQFLRLFLLVLILPMRNGNLMLRQNMASALFVLILPMRNGNFVLHQQVHLHRMFLSYLWGMETCHHRYTKHVLTWFLSYLWGMETNIDNKKMRPNYLRSYPTYEEWKPFKW